MTNFNAMIPENIHEAIEVLFYRSKFNSKQIRNFATNHGKFLDSSKMSRYLDGGHVIDLELITMIEDFCGEYPVTEYLNKRCMIGKQPESHGDAGSAQSTGDVI